MSLLEARELAVVLGGRGVLHGISVEFDVGEMVGLIGPNGAGKTTLLRSLVGLLAPVSGVVMLDGTSVASVPAREFARKVAYLPQGGRPHWPVPVRELVMLGRLPWLGPWRGPTAEDRAAADRAMAATGIDGFADRRATELSGGEQARVLLARALAGDPKVLLADEPVAGLDPYHRLEVIEHLAALAAGGMAVVVVLHDLTLASRFCRRLVLLDAGRIAADGAPSAVLSPERLADVYRVRAIAGREGGEGYIVPWQRLGPAPRGD